MWCVVIVFEGGGGRGGGGGGYVVVEEGTWIQERGEVSESVSERGLQAL